MMDSIVHTAPLPRGRAGLDVHRLRMERQTIEILQKRKLFSDFVISTA